MRTAAFLRGELHRAKEQFDRAVFDRGLLPEERLTRWQAFLMKVKPLSEELARAEKHEALRRTQQRTRYAERVLQL